MDHVSGPQQVSAPDRRVPDTSTANKAQKMPPPIATKPKNTANEHSKVNRQDSGTASSNQVVFKDSLSKVGGDTKSDGHALRMLQKHGKQKRLERHDSKILQMKRMQDRAELDFIYREDIAAWFTKLFDLDEAMTADTVMNCIESGELLCKLAGQVHENLKEWKYKLKVGKEKLDTVQPPVYKSNAAPGSFHARSNLHNFLVWARDLEVPCLFESSDLIEHKNTNTITSCLMDVARGAPYLKALPALIEFEKEMDAYDDAGNDDGGDTNNNVDDGMNALVQEVAAIVELEKLQTKSPATSPAPSEESDNEAAAAPPPDDDTDDDDTEEAVQVEPAGKGQYWIKGQKMHVRCFNNHIVVRVGGGWDTLGHYLSTLGGKSKSGMNVVEADKIAKNILEEKKNPKKRTTNKSSISTGKTPQSYGPAINTIDLVRTKEEGATTVTVLDAHHGRQGSAQPVGVARSGSRLKNALNVADVTSTPARTSTTARGTSATTGKKSKTPSHLTSPQGASAPGGKNSKEAIRKASSTKKKKGPGTKLTCPKSSSAGDLPITKRAVGTTKHVPSRRQATPEMARAKRRGTPDAQPRKATPPPGTATRASPATGERPQQQHTTPPPAVVAPTHASQPSPEHVPALAVRAATPDTDAPPLPHGDDTLWHPDDTSGVLVPGASDGPRAPRRHGRLDANTPLPLGARSVTPSRSMLPRPSPQGSTHADGDTPCPTPDGRHTPHDGVLYSSRPGTSCGTPAGSRLSSRASTGRSESRSESRNGDGVLLRASPDSQRCRPSSVGEMPTGGRARIIVTSSTPPASATPEGARGVRRFSHDTVPSLPEHDSASPPTQPTVPRSQSDEQTRNTDVGAHAPPDAAEDAEQSPAPKNDGERDAGTPPSARGQSQLAVRARTTDEDRVSEVIFLCENLLRVTTDTRHERDLALQLGYQLGLLHTSNAADELMALALRGEWRAILDHAVRAQASPSKCNRQYTVL
eukprot:m.595331 g.595331  ORF g.595331 m.595331 type:complete len:980 (-) comp22401_c0_seq2:320-3259(-)